MKQLKTNNTDFTYESLPKNRKEQFFQIIKDNFPLLLKLGLFCLLFLLPFIFAFYFKESYLIAINEDVSFTLEKKQAMSFSIEMIFNAIYIFCIGIFFIGLGGVLKILRRLIWNEPIFFKEDFLLGIKDNLIQSLFTGFLIGILYFLSILFIRLTSDTARIISYIFIVFSFAIIVPILLETVYISSIYKNKYNVSFSNSGRLFLRRGLFILFPIILIYAIYLISIIPLGLIYLCIFFIFIFVFILPLIFLLSYILNIKILDDYINRYYYPDKAYLGLYISKEKQKEIEECVKKVE